MRNYQIAERFRAVFAADAAFAGIATRVDQSSASVARPALVFAATSVPLNGTGSALSFVLTLAVESPGEKRSEDDPVPEEAHEARVAAVQAKLHGTGKVALLAAVTGTGWDFRGWSYQEGETGVEDSHFRTALVMRGVVLVG